MTRRYLPLLLSCSLTACLDTSDPPEVTVPTGDELDELDELDDAAALEADAAPLDEADVGQLAACNAAGTNIRRSLVVTDPQVLAKFSFDRVVSRIRATASVAPTTNKALFQTWMRTFAAPACNTADPNHYGLTCPRTPEAKLATVDPFVAASNVSFRPVGLFNRFDLAPANGANCGEYRIVYAMTSTNPNIGGRAFIIFEAALPNPTPSAGKKGCLPVAQFWRGLTDDPDVNSRAAKLEKLYLTGGAVAGFPTVVHAKHYGLATNAGAATAGQVRTNFFVDGAEWHLREFKLRRTCTDTANPATCSVRFQHVPVKANPANELFAGTHAQSAAFRTAFPAQVPALARGDVSTIGMATGNQFNELESVPFRGDVAYRNHANAAMKSAIQAKLTAMGSTLTVANILDRATTQTCAGCHLDSGGVALGGGLTFPTSLGFVHIDEGRNLSPALTTRFLPHRKTVLEAFINANCTAAAAAEGELSDDLIDDEITIGGSTVGAH